MFVHSEIDNNFLDTKFHVGKEDDFSNEYEKKSENILKSKLMERYGQQ